MFRPFLRAAAALALVALLAPTPARAQAVSSLAMVGATSSATDITKPGCWGCAHREIGGVCDGGFVPGWWNCTNTMAGCSLSSPGCGAGASLPLDADGASQYVSRGVLLGLDVAMAEAGEATRVNCEGVIVARHQDPAAVALVRARSAALTL